MGILVVAVLLLVIMPALLYLMGWGVARYIRKAPGRSGLMPRRKEPLDKPIGERPVQSET